MTIRIARGARSAWREGRLQSRVQSKADPDLLHSVVSEIGGHLLELDTDDEYGPKFVSDLLVLSDGIAFWLDSPAASPSMVDRIVATIIDGLDSAGVEARLSGGTRGVERARGPQVVLAAVPHHAPARDAIAVVPWDEIVRALDWAFGNADAEVVVESGAVVLDLPHVAAREYVLLDVLTEVVAGRPGGRRPQRLRALAGGPERMARRRSDRGGLVRRAAPRSTRPVRQRRCPAAPVAVGGHAVRRPDGTLAVVDRGARRRLRGDRGGLRVRRGRRRPGGPTSGGGPSRARGRRMPSPTQVRRPSSGPTILRPRGTPPSSSTLRSRRCPGPS